MSGTFYAPGHVLPNGATVLKSALEKRERPMTVVLAQFVTAPFVTWIVRPSDQCAFAGHYFTDLDEALRDFHERVEGAGKEPERQGAWGSMTLTAGELVAHLSRSAPDTPVTIGAPDELGVDWLNIEGVEPFREDESVSIILRAANDFDTRQW